MDANTLVAATTKSTATILGTSVDGTSDNTVGIKSLDSPGNTMTRKTK